MIKAKVILFKKPGIKSATPDVRPKNEVLEAIIRAEDDRDRIIEKSLQVEKENQQLSYSTGEYGLYVISIFAYFIILISWAILLK